MTAEAKINAIAPWFGGKRELAPRIVAELGKHTMFLDAFCGSMAVLFAKPASAMEIVCDRHGDIVNLARVMQHPQLGAQFYRRARRLMCLQKQFQEVKSACDERAARAAPTEPSVDAALEFLLFSWLGRNGVAGSTGGNNFCVRYTANGGSPAKRLKSTVESIPAFRERLRRVIVLNEDAFHVLERIDDREDTAIYADPPYFKKSSKYIHDFKEADHERLARALQRFKLARIVVSYYDHPEVRRLYSGWTFVDCEMTKGMAKAGQRGGGENTKAPELLIINGPSFTVPKEEQLFSEGAA